MTGIGGVRGNLIEEGLRAAANRGMGALSRSAPDVRETFDALVAQISEGKSAAGQAASGSGGASMVESLMDGLGAVQNEMGAAEALPEQLVSGQLESFEQLAAQVKRADLTFRFSLEIRNRLVDAYREVMRMTV
ncbi:MAG: flagellar hook-basal body complex protein FliE [Planctomycetota bacterium]